MKNENQNQESKVTSLTTPSKFTQADIPELLKNVNAKIKELSKNDSILPVITVGLPGFGPIKDINSVLKLIQACSSIDRKKEAYDLAAVKYLPQGIKKPPFAIEGHSAEEWLAVLTTKMAEIAHKKELEKLKSIKDTLEANLSQEMKLANDLQKISELLNED